MAPEDVLVWFWLVTIGLTPLLIVLALIVNVVLVNVIRTRARAEAQVRAGQIPEVAERRQRKVKR